MISIDLRFWKKTTSLSSTLGDDVSLMNRAHSLHVRDPILYLSSKPGRGRESNLFHLLLVRAASIKNDESENPKSAGKEKGMLATFATKALCGHSMRALESLEIRNENTGL